MEIRHLYDFISIDLIYNFVEKREEALTECHFSSFEISEKAQKFPNISRRFKPKLTKTLEKKLDIKQQLMFSLMNYLFLIKI